MCFSIDCPLDGKHGPIWLSPWDSPIVCQSYLIGCKIRRKDLEKGIDDENAPFKMFYMKYAWIIYQSTREHILMICSINLLWPKHPVWRHEIESTLAYDGTKPLSEPMLASHEWGRVSPEDNHTRDTSAINTEIRLVITYWRFHSNLPGYDVLNNDRAISNVPTKWCKLHQWSL